MQKDKLSKQFEKMKKIKKLVDVYNDLKQSGVYDTKIKSPKDAIDIYNRVKDVLQKHEVQINGDRGDRDGEGEGEGDGDGSLDSKIVGTIKTMISKFLSTDEEDKDHHNVILRIAKFVVKKLIPDK